MFRTFVPHLQFLETQDNKLTPTTWIKLSLWFNPQSCKRETEEFRFLAKMPRTKKQSEFQLQSSCFKELLTKLNKWNFQSSKEDQNVDGLCLWKGLKILYHTGMIQEFIILEIIIGSQHL